MGGDWHDIGGVLSGESAGFVELQPLAAIDDSSERAWAAEWISRDPWPRKNRSHAGSTGASVVGIDLTTLAYRDLLVRRAFHP